MVRIVSIAVLAWLAGWFAPVAAAAELAFPLPVHVVVTDRLDQPVAGARVNLSAPGMAAQGADTDGRGVARFDLQVSGPLTIAVSTTKDGYAAASDTLEVGPADRGRTARLDVALGKPDETILAVTVIDRQQRRLAGIPVSVTHVRLGDMVADRPPEYQGVTGSDGVARIAVQTGRYPRERLLGTELRVQAMEQQSALADTVRRTVSENITLHYGLPAKSLSLMMLESTLSTDTAHGMPVQVVVIDENSQPVEGADVLLRGELASQSRRGRTDSRGIVLLEATVTGPGNFGIEVSKPGFAEGRNTIALDPKDRGQRVRHAGVRLAKLAGSKVEHRVFVRVTDVRGQQPLEGASVRLRPLAAGGQALSATTDSGGRSLLAGAVPGAYELQVSHDRFETWRGPVQLENRDIEIPVALTETVRSREDGIVEVMVTALDRTDARGRPAPISGARVVHGNSTVGTDEHGKAVVRFTSALGVNIMVHADGYKPRGVSVDGGRYVAIGKLTRNVRLEPADPDDSTPFTLTIRVHDSATRQPIPGATINLLISDGRSIGRFTATDGEVSIGVGSEQAKLSRQGLFVEAGATGYDGSRTTIPPDLLRPSREPVMYLAQLAKTNSIADAIQKAKDAAAAAVAAEAQRVSIQFEVNDSVTPYAPIAGARIRLLGADGQPVGADITTGGDGKATAEWPAKAAAQWRYGLAAVISADRFLESRSTIPASLLEPAAQPGRIPVLLDRAGLAAALDRLKRAAADIKDKSADAVAAEKQKVDATAATNPSGLSDGSPLEILIRVEDAAAPHEPVFDAKIRLRLADGTPLEEFPGEFWVTGSDGVIVRVPPRFILPARRGLTGTVSADGFREGRFTIEAARLVPSREDPTYLVPLERLPDDLTTGMTALDAEIAKLEAQRGEILGLDAALQREAVQAAAAEQDARSVLDAPRQRSDGGVGTTYDQLLRDRIRFCTAAVEAARTLGADALHATTEATGLLNAARQQAVTCNSDGTATVIERNFQQANARAQQFAASARQARQQLDRFLQLAGAAEKANADEISAIEAAQRKTADAIKRALALTATRQAKAAELERGYQQAVLKLNAMVGKPGLVGERVAALATLGKRLSAVRLSGAEGELLSAATVGEDRLRPLRRVETQLAEWLQKAREFLASFDAPVCREAKRMQADAVADQERKSADLTNAVARNTDLPGRASACRIHAQAMAGDVEVPDLSGLPNSAMAQAVVSRGLAWGGPVPIGDAPSAPQAFGFAGQAPPPRSQVARGTRVQVYVFQDYKAPPVPPPGPPVAPPPITAGQPPVDPPPGPSTWEQIAKAVEVATPFIAAAVAQSRQGKPAQPTQPGQPMVPPAAVAAGGVPAVVGETLERAQARLEAVGLRIGGITRGDRPPTADMAGRIFFQTPAAGSPFPADRSVALKQYGSFANATPAVPSGPGQCQTSTGPLYCTGTFAGAGTMSCNGSAASTFPGTVTVRADGATELRMPAAGGQDFVVMGQMDGGGRVVVNRSEDNGRTHHRWDARFQRTPAGGGATKLAGGGQYEYRTSLGGTPFVCAGNFALQ